MGNESMGVGLSNEIRFAEKWGSLSGSNVSPKTGVGDVCWSSNIF